jgi:hypothetical protein
MKSFIQCIRESEEHASEWMSSSDLAKHISKTAHKQIHKSKEHRILMNHDLAHGGSGHLHYRIKTKSYDGFEIKKVQAASSKKDKDGFTHHASYHLGVRSAIPADHMKTHYQRKVTVPWHMKDDEIKRTTGR